MGQYYKIVNLDKKQYLHPHKFKDGLKLLEFGCSAPGTMTALAVLLADGNNRGGGDLKSDNPLIGSWAGDRIVVAGDYADPNPSQYSSEDMEKLREDNLPDHDEFANLYRVASHLYEDISKKVIEVLKADKYLADALKDC